MKCEKDFRYILESRNHLYGKRKWTNKLQKFCAIISYLHKMHPCERDFEENFWIAWLFGHNAQKYGLCAFDFASYQRIENILSGLGNERSHWRTQYISWLIFFFYEVLKLVEKKNFRNINYQTNEQSHEHSNVVRSLDILFLYLCLHTKIYPTKDSFGLDLVLEYI